VTLVAMVEPGGRHSGLAASMRMPDPRIGDNASRAMADHGVMGPPCAGDTERNGGPCRTAGAEGMGCPGDSDRWRGALPGDGLLATADQTIRPP